MDSRHLGDEIVTEYSRRYRSLTDDYTIASVPLKSEMNRLRNSMARLTKAMIRILPEQLQAIRDSRADAYDFLGREFVDTEDFLQGLIRRDVARTEAEATLAALRRDLAHSFRTGPDRKRLSGMSLFYPALWSEGSEDISNYEDLAFAKRTQWLKFLRFAVPGAPSSRRQTRKR